jgi:hypothetical protein
VSLSGVELAPFTTPHDVLRDGDYSGPVETLAESLPGKGPRIGMVTTGADMYFLQQLVALMKGS